MMIKLFSTFCFTFISLVSTSFGQQVHRLTVLRSEQDKISATDWLVQPVKEIANIYSSADRKGIILFNGLVKRTFRLSPNVACIDYKNLINGQQLLRAVKPEAKVTIND